MRRSFLAAFGGVDLRPKTDLASEAGVNPPSWCDWCPLVAGHLKFRKVGEADLPVSLLVRQHVPTNL